MGVGAWTRIEGLNMVPYHALIKYFLVFFTFTFRWSSTCFHHISLRTKSTKLSSVDHLAMASRTGRSTTTCERKNNLAWISSQMRTSYSIYKMFMHIELLLMF